jgi:hypothetical protein
MSTNTALHIASRGRLLSRLAKTGVRNSPSRFLSSLPSSAAQEQGEEWEFLTAQQKSLPLSPKPSLSLQQAAPRDENENEGGVSHESPSELVYTGNHRMPITSTLHIVTPEEDTPRGTWPVFRLMVRCSKLLLSFVRLSCSKCRSRVSR